MAGLMVSYCWLCVNTRRRERYQVRVQRCLKEAQLPAGTGDLQF